MRTEELKRSTLLQLALMVRPAMASQAYIPSLTHICFDGDDDAAIAYNDITAIVVRSSINLQCCLPGDLLIKTLNSIAAENILLEEDESTVTIAAGRSKMKLPCLPVTDFPFEYPPAPKASVLITNDILAGIEMCLVAVGNDPTHPAQMGVTLEQGKAGAVLYSTDNFTVSRYQSDSKVSLPAEVPVILPTFFCQQLLALAKAFPGERIDLNIHSGSLSADFGGHAQLFTKQLMDLDVMDFSTILKKYKVDSMVAEVAVDIPDDFDAAFERALLVLSNEQDKITKITMTKDKMKLLSTSSSGEASDVLAYPEPSSPSEPFFVDPVLISRASKICSKIAVLEQVLVLGNHDYSFVHMIAHCTK